MEIRQGAAVAAALITGWSVLHGTSGVANAETSGTVSGTATIRLNPSQPLYSARLFVSTPNVSSSDSNAALISVGPIPANESSTFTVPWSFNWFLTPGGLPTENLRFTIAAAYGSADSNLVSVAVNNPSDLLGLSWDTAFDEDGSAPIAPIYTETNTANGLRTNVWSSNWNFGDRFEFYDRRDGFAPQLINLPIGGDITQGISGQLVNFSDGSAGGTFQAVSTVVPEPASASVLLVSSTFGARRRRRAQEAA